MLETDRTARLVNTYDSQGELISVTSYNEDDEVMFSVDYKRGTDGKIISVKEESPEGIVNTSIVYDDKGNAIAQEDKNEKGEVNSHIERKYDEEGNVLETEAILDRHGAGMNQHYILKYEYEFF